MKDIIVVTNWEKVERNDFYLGKEWKEDKREAKRLQKIGKLYIAYIVPAVSYCLFSTMDAEQVFIDRDGNIVLHCEITQISNSHRKRWEMEI